MAGSSAPVIIANPSGIRCNGGGVINVPQLTLTTGTPQLSPKGALEGFRVTKGRVLVTGNGLDAQSTDYTAILARAVSLQGELKAGKTLQVLTGAQQVELNAAHEATSLTALSPRGKSTAFGIDVAALGGMYAGKIRLVATEAGVGVRLAGKIEAKDALSVTSAGELTIQGARLASGLASGDPTLPSTTPSIDPYSCPDSREMTCGSDLPTPLPAGFLKLVGHQVTIEGGDLRATGDLEVIASGNLSLAAIQGQGEYPSSLEHSLPSHASLPKNMAFLDEMIWKGKPVRWDKVNLQAKNIRLQTLGNLSLHGVKAWAPKQITLSALGPMMVLTAPEASFSFEQDGRTYAGRFLEANELTGYYQGITLQALGGDLVVNATHLNAKEGTLKLTAVGDVLIGAPEQIYADLWDQKGGHGFARKTKWHKYGHDATVWRWRPIFLDATSRSMPVRISPPMRQRLTRKMT